MFIQAKQASQTVAEIQQNNIAGESVKNEDTISTAQSTAQSQAIPVQSLSGVTSSVSSTLPSPGLLSSTVSVASPANATIALTSLPVGPAMSWSY